MKKDNSNIPDAREAKDLGTKKGDGLDHKTALASFQSLSGGSDGKEMLTACYPEK